MLFRCANPAELLLSVKTLKTEVKKKTPDGEAEIAGDDPPRVSLAQAVTVFVLVQRYRGLRLVDVVTLRMDSLREDRLMIMRQQKKPNNRSSCPSPRFVVDRVRKLPPKSPKYFFWAGTSTIKTAVNDRSEKMRQLYVEAGIEGKRTHEWRDTLAIEVLEGGGTLEECATAAWPQVAEDH